MKRVSVFALVLGLLAAGCHSASTTPSPTGPSSNIIFTAQLLSANETPAPITGPEQPVNGTATITFVPTKDSTGAITSAVATASVTVQGFPAGSLITLAHIHTGGPGVGGPVLVPFIPTTTLTPVNGGGFSQTTNVTADQINGFINNPAGFYFNVHTSLNPGGVMRGQLVRQ